LVWKRREKGEGEMNALAHVMDTMTPDLQETGTTTSSLYDLIEAISEEVRPGEDELIVEAVLNLMKSGQIKWVSRHRNLKPI
jgi:hypothetical protein